MKIGKVERGILVKLQEAERSIQVTETTMTRSQADVHLLAARQLKRKGLVTLERRISRLRWPTRVVVWVAFTELGTTFADVFQHQIRSGGKIRAARFRQLTGKALPESREGVRPAWLVHNRQRTPQ